MKWTLLVLQTLHGISRLSKQAKSDLRHMNLLVIVITTQDNVEKETTERARLASIMQAGTGQFEMQIFALNEKNRSLASAQLADACKFMKTVVALQPAKNLPVIEEAL